MLPLNQVTFRFKFAVKGKTILLNDIPMQDWSLGQLEVKMTECKSTSLCNTKISKWRQL
jgi:hypothetical protein